MRLAASRAFMRPRLPSYEGREIPRAPKGEKKLGNASSFFTL